MLRASWFHLLLGLLASLGGLGFTSCGGSGVSRTDALEGAKAFLDENEPFCLALVLVTSEPPWIVTNDDPQQAYLLRFEKLGLLAARPTTKSEKGYSALGSVTRELPALELAPTPYGQVALVRRNFLGMDSYCFRFARAKVADVLEWTEPAPQMGVVVSHVTFTLQADTVASWTEDPSFAELFPEANLELAAVRAEPRRLSTTLVKTSNGWRPATSQR